MQSTRIGHGTCFCAFIWQSMNTESTQSWPRVDPNWVVLGHLLWKFPKSKSRWSEVDPGSTLGLNFSSVIFFKWPADKNMYHLNKFHVRAVDPMRPSRGQPRVDPSTRRVLIPVIFWVDQGLTRGRPWVDLFFTIFGGRYPLQKHVPC